MKLCIFEDEKYDNFYPISLTRPVFCIKLGFEELYKRDARILGRRVDRAFSRDYLAAVSSRILGFPVNPGTQLDEDDWFFLNGRVMDPGKLDLEGPDEVGMSGSDVVFARASSETVKECVSSDFKTLLDNLLKTCDHVDIDVPLAEYIWDLMLRNSQALVEDFGMLGKRGIEGSLAEGSYFVGDENQVYIAPTAKVDPLVVLDTTHGPIYVDEGARIFPHTRVEGPSYIGRETQLVGGKIREGCSIGPACRIGGEVEESIFHGHSNKYHSGFIGHSYVGEWVNLGALTTNSDLKNDYSSVHVFVRGRSMETNSPKVGSFIADHVKTGIGSLLNTGTVVGVMSVLMPSGDVLPKNIPSFCLLYKNQIRSGLGFNTLVDTARKVMSRRGVDLNEDDILMLKHVYEMTAEERESLIRRDRRKRARLK